MTLPGIFCAPSLYLESLNGVPLYSFGKSATGIIAVGGVASSAFVNANHEPAVNAKTAQNPACLLNEIMVSPLEKGVQIETMGWAVSQARRTNISLRLALAHLANAALRR